MCVCVCVCVFVCVCVSVYSLLCCLRFVGQLYAAEALVLLDRIPEALHYLSPDIVTNISATLTPRKPTGIVSS